MRIISFTFLVFLLGFVAGNAFWYLFSPLWIDRVVSEALPPELMLTAVKSGNFTDADASHKGSGRAAILAASGGTQLLRLTDFEVTNGPDLEVWLVEAPAPQSASDVTESQWLSLGTLKGNKGDQTYIIPEGTDIARYGSTVIWCEQFGVLFSAASFESAEN